MKCGGGGVVEHFFNAVQLTIIAQWIFLALYSLWRWFDFQHNRTRMTWPRQKWHSEVSVGPSLTSNKWQQICYKPETLQNRWPAEFTNLKSTGGGCCCTYVAHSAGRGNLQDWGCPGDTGRRGRAKHRVAFYGIFIERFSFLSKFSVVKWRYDTPLP